MQFKGSVRAPGDRDPGVRVVLDIDEYHLEIRRDTELFGRYYLADVEVARDIAERFILFLGDDEVEFLADDALQFAYGGVTAMQEAWLEAQRKKRRHRRAADAAARRKDDEPRAVGLETPIPDQALHVSESDAVRRRRLQTGSPNRSIPPPGRQAPAARAATSPTSSPDNGSVSRMGKGSGAPDVVKEVREPPLRRKAPPMPSLAEPATFGVINDELYADEDIVDDAMPGDVTPEHVTSEDVTSLPAGTEDSAEIDETEDTSLAARRRKITARAKPEAIPDTKRRIPSRSQRKARPEATPEPRSVAPSNGQRLAKPEAIPEPPAEAPYKGQRKDKPKESDLGRVRLPEPASARSAQPAAEAESKVGDEPIGVADPEAAVSETAGQVRFAQEGHHPSETSTGLLAKLRGQPRRPSNHVHRFKESGSSVGLVRRVCTECAFVSIGSED